MFLLNGRPVNVAMRLGYREPAVVVVPVRRSDVGRGTGPGRGTASARGWVWVGVGVWGAGRREDGDEKALEPNRYQKSALGLLNHTQPQVGS